MHTMQNKKLELTIANVFQFRNSSARYFTELRLNIYAGDSYVRK